MTSPIKEYKMLEYTVSFLLMLLTAVSTVQLDRAREHFEVIERANEVTQLDALAKEQEVADMQHRFWYCVRGAANCVGYDDNETARRSFIRHMWRLRQWIHWRW